MLDILNQINNFKSDRHEISEVVAMLAFAELMMMKYEELGEPKPIDLSNSITDMQQELARRTRDRKMERVAELQRYINRNKPKEIKVSEANSELEKLRKELGITEGVSSAAGQ